MLHRARDVARRAALATPLRRAVLFRYRFMYRPAQLCFLLDGLNRTAHLDGPVVEVGCALGATAVFLSSHLDDTGDQRPYVAIDTFRGFLPEDIAVERGRGKRAPYERLFTNVSKQEFDAAMALNGITRVRSVQADANTFDWSQLDRVSFALVDVDLYRPVGSALRGLWPRMAPGGLVVVDDCGGGDLYDGAAQAYTEFCAEIGVAPDVRLGKLGVLEVPADG